MPEYSTNKGPLDAHPAKAQLRFLLSKVAHQYGLTTTDVSLLVERSRLGSWDAGTTLCCSADRDELMNFLLCGAIRIELVPARGEHVVLAVVGPGEFFCLPPSPDHGEYHLRAVPHVPSMVALIGRPTLSTIIGGLAPGGVLQLITNSWLTLSRVAEEQCWLRRRRVRQRILHALQRLARQFGRPCVEAKGTMIDLPLRCIDLARIVGASRANVSRGLKVLQRAGLVARQDGRLVLSAAESGGA